MMTNNFLCTVGNHMCRIQALILPRNVPIVAPIIAIIPTVAEIVLFAQVVAIMALKASFKMRKNTLELFFPFG